MLNSNKISLGLEHGINDSVSINGIWCHLMSACHFIQNTFVYSKSNVLVFIKRRLMSFEL